MADKIFPTDFSNLSAVDLDTTLLGDDAAANGLLTKREIVGLAVVKALTGVSNVLVLTDQGKTITMNHSALCNLNIPANASVAFPVGTVIDVVQIGAGQVEIEAAPTVTLNGVTGTTVYSPNRWSRIRLIQTATDVWVAIHVDVDAAGATMNADTTLVGNGYFLDEDTMSSDDATKVASQQSIKAYVDNLNTATYSSGQTLTAAECHGYVIYVTGAATIVLPAIASGMSVTIITIGAVAVSVDPNASDKIWLDGTALDDGDKITNLSTAGDIATLTYYSADGWYASTNGWSDGGA